MYEEFIIVKSKPLIYDQTGQIKNTSSGECFFFSLQRISFRNRLEMCVLVLIFLAQIIVERMYQILVKLRSKRQPALFAFNCSRYFLI
jgi:hypothetical protein